MACDQIMRSVLYDLGKFKHAYQTITFLTASEFEQDQTLLWTCVAGAHCQCVNSRYSKFK